MEKTFNKATVLSLRKTLGLFIYMLLMIGCSIVLIPNVNKYLFMAIFAGILFPKFIRILSVWIVKYKITDNHQLTTTWGTSINIAQIDTIITNITKQLTLICINPKNNKSYRQYYSIEDKDGFINALLQVNSKILIETEE